jgi:hypothetical protein
MVSDATPTAPRTAAFRQTPSTATLPTSRRRGSVISPEETQTSVSSITAPDMSLFISTEGHETTVLNCVKKHLFPRCKFITSNTDLDYDSKEGICSFMLVHCGVKHNSRDWWKHYKLKVKKKLLPIIATTASKVCSRFLLVSTVDWLVYQIITILILTRALFQPKQTSIFTSTSSRRKSMTPRHPTFERWSSCVGQMILLPTFLIQTSIAPTATKSCCILLGPLL